MALDLFVASIAAELHGLAATTETLAATLCADEEVAVRCLALLQQFDLLAQSQAELANLLLRLRDGADRDTALAAIRLSGMADRLKRAA